MLEQRLGRHHRLPVNERLLAGGKLPPECLLARQTIRFDEFSRFCPKSPLGNGLRFFDDIFLALKFQ
jgi:hypothetical protein